VCGTRTRLRRAQRDASNPLPDVIFWVAVALLGAGFAALLVWVR
jgi:hypothetical protein